MAETLISTAEAAQRTGRCRSRIYQLIESGKIKTVKRAGLPILVLESSLARYLDKAAVDT